MDHGSIEDLFERNADMRLLEFRNTEKGKPPPQATRRTGSSFGAESIVSGQQDHDIETEAMPRMRVSVAAAPSTGVIPGAVIGVAIDVFNDGNAPAPESKLLVSLPHESEYRTGTLRVDGREVQAPEALFVSGLPIARLPGATSSKVTFQLAVLPGIGALYLQPRLQTNGVPVVGTAGVSIKRGSSATAAVAEPPKPFYELEDDEIAEVAAQSAEDILPPVLHERAEPAPQAVVPVAPPPEPEAIAAPAEPNAAQPVMEPVAATPAPEPVAATPAPEFVPRIEPAEPPVDPAAAKAEVEVPVAKAPVDVPVAKAQAEVPVAKAPVEAPVAKVPVEAPVAKAPVDVPVAKAPVEIPAAKAPVAKALVDVPAANAQVDIPAAKTTTDVAAAKGAPDVPAAKAAPDVRAAKVTTDGPPAGASVDVPSAKASTDVQAAKAPIDAPSAEAPVDAPVAKASVDTPATKEPVDVPAATAPVDVAAPKAAMDAGAAKAPVDVRTAKPHVEAGPAATVPVAPNVAVAKPDVSRAKAAPIPADFVPPQPAPEPEAPQPAAAKGPAKRARAKGAAPAAPAPPADAATGEQQQPTAETSPAMKPVVGTPAAAAEERMTRYRTLGVSDIALLERLFVAEVPGVIAHYVVISSIACNEPAGGADASGYDAFLRRDIELLGRALVHSRMGKAPQYRIAQDDLNELHLEWQSAPPAPPPFPAPRRLRRDLRRPELTAVAGLIQPSERDATLRTRIALLALAGSTLDGVDARTADECTTALAAYRSAVLAWLVPLCVASAGTDSFVIPAPPATVDAAGRRLVSVLKLAVVS